MNNDSYQKRIADAINRWDPIGLLSSHAPDDEYLSEIMAIYRKVEVDPAITANSLARVINDVFVDFFGDTYEEDMQLCLKVAEDILS